MPARLFLALVLFACVTPAQTGPNFFSQKLYPAFRAVQCHMCHNDNGVANGTRFEFPPDDASEAQIEAFGVSLARVVNRDAPEASLLYLKPTNRAKHPGGERIKQGSDQEKLLLRWVRHLAALSPEQIAAAGRAPGEAGAARHALSVRRLTHSQYNNAVRDLVGELSRPADQFPPEDFIHGFKNQIHGQSTSPLLMEAYSAAAEKVARNAFRGGDQNGLVPCAPASPNDAACMQRFVRSFGKRAFRRPLTEAEAQRYSELALTLATEHAQFLSGAQVVVEAMLQSPHFLMRFEYGPGTPNESYENAAKLSFFLWNTIPDDWLLGLADAAALRTSQQIQTAAAKMLDDPRAPDAMDEFLSQWMRFDRALETIRDRKYYPDFNSELAAAMTEETRRLFRHLAWGDRDFRALFNADYTFVNAELAQLYGLPEPDEPFARTSYPPDTKRAGVIGQGTFLLLTSKPSDTSPTERGLFVREHFLCQAVPPPPPGVNATLPPLTDAKPMTNRDRLAVHLANEACSGCHRLVDPIGLGLEQFDAIGRYREKFHVVIPPTRDEAKRKVKTKATEYDLDIDVSADIVGIAGSSFSSPKQLGAILANDPGCQKCVVKQVFRYALGRDETLADRVAIDATLERFESSGFHFKQLLLGVVSSQPFLGGIQ